MLIALILIFVGAFVIPIGSIGVFKSDALFYQICSRLLPLYPGILGIGMGMLVVWIAQHVFGVHTS